jgi:hypothetical protein
MENVLLQNLFFMNSGKNDQKDAGFHQDPPQQQTHNQGLPPDTLLQFYLSQQNNEPQNMPVVSNPYLSGDILGYPPIPQQHEEQQAQVNEYHPVQEGTNLWLHNLLNQQNELKNAGKAEAVVTSNQFGRNGSASSLANATFGAGSLGAFLSQNESFATLTDINSPHSFHQPPTQTIATPQHNNASWGDMSGGQQKQQEEKDPYTENGMLGPWSAASAALLGDLALTNQEKSKKARKKAKDKPKRPLSAYNVFFKEERQRILKEIPDLQHKVGVAQMMKNGKKPHGKIDFQSLAKVVGKRWQNLPPDELKSYKEKANIDMLRYKKEMEAYSVREEEKNKF